MNEITSVKLSVAEIKRMKCYNYVCLIDSPLPKMAGLAGLLKVLNLLLQKAEGLADFGEILDFICKTLRTRQLCTRCDGNR